MKLSEIIPAWFLDAEYSREICRAGMPNKDTFSKRFVACLSITYSEDNVSYWLISAYTLEDLRSHCLYSPECKEEWIYDEVMDKYV